MKQRKLRQFICIIHHREGDAKWLIPLLQSINTEYPVVITNHTGSEWCMGAIQQTCQRLDYDEIVFLNESMVIKDNAVWDILFKDYAGQSVMLGERFLMFFGKFRRQQVDKLTFPTVRNKIDDVLLGEGQWCRQYMELGEYVELQPLADGNRFTEKHGRTNMVLENDYFIKWKGSWDMETLLRNA
jgi:hypothetical protein